MRSASGDVDIREEDSQEWIRSRRGVDEKYGMSGSGANKEHMRSGSEVCQKIGY